MLRVAYSIIGSMADAEDCVQEAWLRLHRATDHTTIDNLPAWLTKTVGRLALDALDRARTKREQYVGHWLPEPIVEELHTIDPAERVAVDESVNMALLVVLERLTPAERTSFLLHDVFGLTFQEIALIIHRTPAAVRKLAARARQHIVRARPRFAPTCEEQTKLITAFMTACRNGDLDSLVSLLDSDVVMRSDGGGKVAASRQVRQGAALVAQQLVFFSKRTFPEIRIALVNGAPGLVLKDADGILSVVAFAVDQGLITSIDVIRNPDKLTHIRISNRPIDDINMRRPCHPR